MKTDNGTFKEIASAATMATHAARSAQPEPDMSDTHTGITIVGHTDVAGCNECRVGGSGDDRCHTHNDQRTHQQAGWGWIRSDGRRMHQQFKAPPNIREGKDGSGRSGQQHEGMEGGGDSEARSEVGG